jgi:O-succinylbenzoic acid--CoA ligase
MELIIQNGHVLNAIEHFPEIKLWVDDWLSDKSKFEFETSGTSGIRKQLIFSRQQLVASAKRTCEFFHLESGTKVLHRLPMQFVAGKMNIIRALVSGHSVWAERPSMHFDLPWNPENLHWDWWPTTPAMMTAFLEAKLDVNVFQRILLGGGKVLPKLLEDMTCFKGNCFESYGATETLTHIAVRSITPKSTHFQLLPGVRMTENHDGIVINDEVTEIQVSLNDAIHFMNEKEFEVLGRLDDVINSGGVKIHPLLVEEVLSRFTSLPFYITQSPDNLWGNAVTLVVIESDMIHWKSLNLKMIFENHPNWKPKRMITVQKIDRNENGKIIRKINPEGLVNSL